MSHQLILLSCLLLLATTATSLIIQEKMYAFVLDSFYTKKFPLSSIITRRPSHAKGGGGGGQNPPTPTKATIVLRISFTMQDFSRIFCF